MIRGGGTGDSDDENVLDMLDGGSKNQSGKGSQMSHNIHMLGSYDDGGEGTDGSDEYEDDQPDFDRVEAEDVDEEESEEDLGFYANPTIIAKATPSGTKPPKSKTAKKSKKKDVPPLTTKAKKGGKSTRSDFGGRRGDYDNSITMDDNKNVGATLNSEGERNAIM